MLMSFWISCHQNLMNNMQSKKVMKNDSHKNPHERHLISILRSMEWGHGSSNLKKYRWNGLHAKWVLFSIVDSFWEEWRREKKDRRGFWIDFCLFGTSAIYQGWEIEPGSGVWEAGTLHDGLYRQHRTGLWVTTLDHLCSYFVQMYSGKQSWPSQTMPKEFLILLFTKIQ